MADGNQTEAAAPAFTSKLKEGRQRFLSLVVEHALVHGRRTPDDFIRHFPPTAIMTGLKNQPRLRGQILVMATGLKEKIAVKKSAESAAEDLQVALDEAETDAAAVLELFQADDRVRYLDAASLWSFLVEGEFWNATVSKKEEFERAKDHLAFMLETALAEKLITHRDVVEGVTVGEIVMRLPKGELHKIIEGALSNAHRGAPFTELDLMATIPPATLLKYVPLPHLYSAVLEPKIALAHGYAGEQDEGDDDDDNEDEVAAAAPAAAPAASS
jgi:hypothetical protein